MLDWRPLEGVLAFYSCSARSQRENLRNVALTQINKYFRRMSDAVYQIREW